MNLVLCPSSLLPYPIIFILYPYKRTGDHGSMQGEILEGLAFTGDEFTPQNVEIIIENGRIAEITDIKTAATQWIVPAIFNAHTHIADTVGMDTPIDRPLAELVAPPNGLKHRLLCETPPDRLVSAMRDTPCTPVSYTHLRAHETSLHLVCRLLLEKKKNTKLNVRISTTVQT
eukprot:TRINITY_DN14994_c0_g1_i1.p1 TRINITY_DN14994_c0_g1~~TRINITY_DN14994_c0_g1_i1.p1  ORF type:complete len:173 (-),score=39.11 TRINITY_DN14994_c0_g1_i1:31-549(-)